MSLCYTFLNKEQHLFRNQSLHILCAITSNCYKI